MITYLYEKGEARSVRHVNGQLVKITSITGVFIGKKLIMRTELNKNPTHFHIKIPIKLSVSNWVSMIQWKIILLPGLKSKHYQYPKKTLIVANHLLLSLQFQLKIKWSHNFFGTMKHAITTSLLMIFQSGTCGFILKPFQSVINANMI